MCSAASRPSLKTVRIHLKQVLHKNGEPLTAVYFPNGGVVSITTVLSDGTSDGSGDGGR